MPVDPGLLDQLGIRVPAMFAGLAGGLVGAYADGKAGLAAWIAYVVSGGLTANFLAEPAQKYIPLVSEGGAGFVVGLTALVIVRTIIGAAKKWHPPSN